LVVLTAIHAGLVATLFWTLLANAIVATQIVEDGTLSSIIVRSCSILRPTASSPPHSPSPYFPPRSSLLRPIYPWMSDSPLHVCLERQIHPNLSTVYHFLSLPVSGQECKSRNFNAASCCLLFRYSAALTYFGLMLYIVLGILNEIRPVWYYVIAAIFFVLSQLDYFLLSKIICRVRNTSTIIPRSLLITRYLQGSSMKVDGSFIATILETACVVTLYFAWRGITEGNIIFPLYFNPTHPRHRGLG
jgi:hypothetical protein